MTAPTTKTGRPKLGGNMDVLATDGKTWIPCEVRAVADGSDSRGQGVIYVTFAFLDDEGGISEMLRWDTITWRPSA
jgi:hypothetical protein